MGNYQMKSGELVEWKVESLQSGKWGACRELMEWKVESLCSGEFRECRACRVDSL